MTRTRGHGANAAVLSAYAAAVAVGCGGSIVSAKEQAEGDADGSEVATYEAAVASDAIDETMVDAPGLETVVEASVSTDGESPDGRPSGWYSICGGAPCRGQCISTDAGESCWCYGLPVCLLSCTFSGWSRP
jgi:hypothetical protein